MKKTLKAKEKEEEYNKRELKNITKSVNTNMDKLRSEMRSTIEERFEDLLGGWR